MVQVLDISNVQFSRNDLRKGIIVPHKITEELAYETGVHIGDGHLNIYRRPTGWVYINVFSGDYSEEMEFYDSVIRPLLHKLYHKEALIKKSTKNTLQIVLKSKAIATFKRDVLGITCGKKKGRIEIPQIIMNSPLKKYCLQGIVDTDFSLTFRGGTYPHITGSLPFENRNLVNQIMSIFESLDIKATCSVTERRDRRWSPPKLFKEYQIDVYGRENLQKWLAVAGFRSSKHTTKAKLWLTRGVCPPRTTIEERKKIIATLAQPGRASGR